MSRGIKDFYRGDTRTYSIVSKAKDGSPLSLHNAKLFITFKSSQSLADADAELHKVISLTEIDPNNPTGVATIKLTHTDTEITPGTYWYDFQLVYANGDVITLIPNPKWDKKDKQVKVHTDTTREIA